MDKLTDAIYAEMIRDKSRDLTIAIDGPQGGGKTTLAKITQSALRARGFKVNYYTDLNLCKSETLYVHGRPKSELVSVLNATPTAWIIERKGCAPTITHYKTVADCQASMGAAVTPYCSQF